MQDVRLNTRNYEGNAFTANGFADFYILPGLTFTVNATANLDETRSTYVYNPYYGQFDTTGGTVVPNYLILCRPLLLPSIFPSIRVFSNESALHIRWPKYWSFSICPSFSYCL